MIKCYSCKVKNERSNLAILYVSGGRHFICRNCRATSYCQHCYSNFKNEDLKTAPNSKKYCQSCYNRFVYICDCCHEPKVFGSHTIDARNNKKYCYECIRYIKFQCRSCGVIEDRVNRSDDAEERGYCNSCYENYLDRLETFKTPDNWLELPITTINGLIKQKEVFSLSVENDVYSRECKEDVSELVWEFICKQHNGRKNFYVYTPNNTYISTYFSDFYNDWCNRSHINWSLEHVDKNLPSMAKRLKQFLFKTLGYRVDDETLQSFGNCIAKYKSTKTDYNIIFTRDLRQPAKAYTHSRSCWWEGYNSGRNVFKQRGGIAVLGFNTPEQAANWPNVIPSHRMWLLPVEQMISYDALGFKKSVDETTLDSDFYFLFNYYTSNSQSNSTLFSNLIKDILGKDSRKISLRRNDSGMYVNGAEGYLIYDKQKLNELRNYNDSNGIRF